MTANHARLEEDVVHMRLSRAELACLRAVLEIAADCPFDDLMAQIDALASRVRQLQEALG